MAVLLCVISSPPSVCCFSVKTPSQNTPMSTSVVPFSAKICVPMAVVDIVSLVTGPANQNALLLQQTGLFWLPKMCILSSLSFMGKINHLLWTEAFSYTVLYSAQVCLGRGGTVGGDWF